MSCSVGALENDTCHAHANAQCQQLHGVSLKKILWYARLRLSVTVSSATASALVFAVSRHVDRSA